MPTHNSPKWLRFVQRYLGWIAIPNIAILIVTLQALGFLLVSSDPIWIDRLALDPIRFQAGEYWRAITFLSLPISLSPIWVLFVLWFIYFILNGIESIWGSFKTTFYVLISVLFTVGVSLILGTPVTQVTDFESTLFLAAAALMPDMEVRLFFVLPVKMKWLGWLTLAFLFVRFLGADMNGRIYLLAIYFNYFLFFGPALYERMKYRIRRENFKRRMSR